MPLIEVKAAIPPASAEAADEFLLEEGLGEWSVLEDVIVKAAWLVGIFPEEAAARAGWSSLAPRLPAAPLSAPEFKVLNDADWRDSYKAHFHAWQFGRLHWVPVWERPTFVLPTGHAVLWLDPGLAFGTGNHETTRLCCERLVAWVERVVPNALDVPLSPPSALPVPRSLGEGGGTTRSTGQSFAPFGRGDGGDRQGLGGAVRAVQLPAGEKARGRGPQGFGDGRAGAEHPPQGGQGDFFPFAVVGHDSP